MVCTAVRYLEFLPLDLLFFENKRLMTFLVIFTQPFEIIPQHYGISHYAILEC